jgi:hypothetical protein
MFGRKQKASFRNSRIYLFWNALLWSPWLLSDFKSSRALAEELRTSERPRQLCVTGVPVATPCLEQESVLLGSGPEVLCLRRVPGL